MLPLIAIENWCEKLKFSTFSTSFVHNFPTWLLYYGLLRFFAVLRLAKKMPNLSVKLVGWISINLGGILINSYCNNEAKNLTTISVDFSVSKVKVLGSLKCPDYHYTSVTIFTDPSEFNEPSGKNGSRRSTSFPVLSTKKCSFAFKVSLHRKPHMFTDNRKVWELCDARPSRSLGCCHKIGQL